MKTLHSCALLVALALCSNAESELPLPSQELFPMESGITSHSLQYFTKLRAVLFENPDTGDPFASRSFSEDEFLFLELPPFAPETLLTISKRGTNYVAVLLSPEKQIWSFDGNTADLGVDRKEKLVPAPVAQRADRLWREMLIRARFAESGVCPDSVSYCFFKWIKGAGTLAAKTHPRSNTKPSMLVRIAGTLVRYVNDESKDEEATLKTLDELMGKLEMELRKCKGSSNPTMEGTE